MKIELLKNLSKFIGSGCTPDRKNFSYWNNANVAWLKTEQLGEYRIDSTNEYISQQAVSECNLRVYPKNTISVAMYGEGKTRGNVSIINAPMTTNQACCNIELDDNKIDHRYVYYYLKMHYQDLRRLSSGVRKNLNSDDIKNFPIRYPEQLEVQKNIADVLSALDDKILLNKKINATLEEMARTLYDYYFVQFDFPDENGKPYKSSGGKMIFNAELNREIPAGWQVCKLSEFGNLKNGINYDKNTSGDKLVKIVNVKDISASKFSITTESLDDIILPSAQIEKYLTTTEDILIARSGIPGAARAITGENKFVIYCGFIICLKLYNQIFKNYLLFTLQKNYEIISVKSTGTIMPNVTQDTLKKIPLIEPPQEILQKFNATVEPMLDELNRKLLENQTLANLRDYLLPLLMNGQVTIKR